MLYDVKLAIDYAYDAPTDHTRNALCLLPGDIPGKQRVLSRLVAVDPLPAERRERVDFFANAETSMVWHAAISAVSLVLTGRVERLPPAPGLDLSPALDGLAREFAGWHSVAPGSPHHFTAASRRTAPHPETTAFARKTMIPGMTALAAVEAMGRALHAEMRFGPEATDVDTPAPQGRRRAPRCVSGFQPCDDFLPARHRHPGGPCLGLPAHRAAARWGAAGRR